MFKVDLRSSIPIHEQIKSGLRDLVIKGLLKPGEDLPSAKSFAETLLVSPNAVLRAYRELVKEGFLDQRPGNVHAIASSAQDRAARSVGDVLQQFVESVQVSRNSGLSYADMESIIALLKDRDNSGGEKVLPEIFSKLFFEPRPASGGMAVCPYCRESIRENEKAARCILCRTAHHDECWTEIGHCSVFGCKGKVKL